MRSRSFFFARPKSDPNRGYTRGCEIGRREWEANPDDRGFDDETHQSADSLSVSRVSVKGLYPDGDGLYLQVTRNDAGAINKSWLLRFWLRGKTREMGLGSLKRFNDVVIASQDDRCAGRQ